MYKEDLALITSNSWYVIKPNQTKQFTNYTQGQEYETSCENWIHYLNYVCCHVFQEDELQSASVFTQYYERHWLITFNSKPTRLRLFYVKMLGNCINCILIFVFFL